MNIYKYIRRTVLALMIGVLFLPQGILAFDLQASTTIDQNLKNIVYISCGNVENGENVFYSTGSGVVLGEGLVITNGHVISYDGDAENWYFYDFCVGGISEHSYLAPIIDMVFVPSDIYFSRTDYFDYSLMTALDLNGEPYIFPEFATYGNPDSLIHGDKLTLIGYPANSGETITSTSGAVSGFEYSNWIKSDAIAEFGNSGGGAFDENGNLIGIPTVVSTGELNSMTYISNINAIFEDMFGEYLMIRDYDTLYTRDNVACFEDSCYHFGEGVDDVIASQNIIATGEENVQIGEKVLELEPETSVYDPDLKDQKIIDRMQGNILLQVEQHGEAWYLHPELDKRYYMKDGPTAYEMMRQFGLGIADADLMKIPAEATPADMLEATSICKTNSLARRLSGRILLQVEQHGEAWYIQPDTCRRIYMKDGESAYNIMRFLSKGIADSNLKAIPSDVLNSNFGQ